MNFKIINRLTNAGDELDTALVKNTNKTGSPFEYYLFLRNQGTKQGNYGVFDTDYTNYAIVFSCDQSTGQQRFYINSRTKGSTAYNNQLVISSIVKLQSYVRTDNIVYSLLTDKNCVYTN